MKHSELIGVHETIELIRWWRFQNACLDEDCASKRKLKDKWDMAG